MTHPMGLQGASNGQLAVPMSNELAVPGMMTGLEDFTAEDLKLARLVIDQKNGVFKDSLSGTEYASVDVITLGVVKQRVMWEANVEEDSSPLCKSTDYANGYPTTWDKATKNFPWNAAGWQPDDFPKDDVGRTVLPCGSCRFKEWKSHPDGKKPWCSTQHAVPVLYAGEGEEPYIQAIFTMQRSSLQASQAFFAGFMHKSMPAFSAKSRIKLTKLKRGQNDYYVPSLRIIEQIDQERWPELSESYREMRDFLTRPPVTRDESGAVVASTIASSNVIQAQPGFDNNSWVPAGTPVAPQQQYAQPAPPVAVPVAQPVQQGWAAAAVAQPVAQPVPVMQAPVMQQSFTSAVDPNDDLPF